MHKSRFHAHMLSGSRCRTIASTCMKTATNPSIQCPSSSFSALNWEHQHQIDQTSLDTPLITAHKPPNFLSGATKTERASARHDSLARDGCFIESSVFFSGITVCTLHIGGHPFWPSSFYQARQDLLLMSEMVRKNNGYRIPGVFKAVTESSVRCCSPCRGTDGVTNHESGDHRRT